MNWSQLAQNRIQRRTLVYTVKHLLQIFVDQRSVKALLETTLLEHIVAQQWKEASLLWHTVAQELEKVIAGTNYGSLKSDHYCKNKQKSNSEFGLQ
jgi:hypothetical protein